jgi:hypothetical protein
LLFAGENILLLMIVTVFFRSFYRVPFAVFLVAAFLIVPARAAAGVSFSWRANPVEDDVVGYRLYYGVRSRSAAGHYDYYIDFTSMERCPAEGGGWGCDPLPASAVSCQDLFREIPKCTVNDLPGRSYLAMTAYNSVSESDYTQEIAYVSPEVRINLQAVYGLLLN